MSVSVANRLIQGRGGLSELGALALAFVDGGVEWLTWAASGSSAGYSFPDETAMIAQVQHGLHASPVTWLPHLELLVSPVKLMTFNLADLRAVAAAEAGADDPATTARISAILAAHGLLRQADFAAVPAFLRRLGVGESPLFGCLGLNAMITLSDLITSPQPQHGEPDIQRDAARFALQQARTPEDFRDYFQAYMALAAKLTTEGLPPDQHAARVGAAVQTLLPLMFDALDCPQVGGLVSPAEVAAVVNSWLRQGRRLGFSRLSQGVCRIIDSTTFATETGQAAQQVINLYLANAQSFISANDPKTGRISQDGRSCVLPAQSGNLYAELLLSRGGGITLQQFRRIPPPIENT